MELTTFARFHAREGREAAVMAEILAGVVPSSHEAGCLAIAAYRSIRDPRLFYIHSRWRDEAAFELHATLPHTVRLIERVGPLIDHPLDVARTRPIWPTGDR
jgi:quinol monooxygenase YgiN